MRTTSVNVCVHRKLKRGVTTMVRAEAASQPPRAKTNRGRRTRRGLMPSVRRAVTSESEDMRLRPARMPIRTPMGTVKARMAGMR